MHVLFVDDDELVSQSVEEALRRAGHSCEIAELGSEAIALAKANTYDIVVLDIGLPDMDGYHVIRRLKLEGIRVPILLQSGLSDPDLVAEGAELGVEDFLPKPFSIKELISHMESVVVRSGDGTTDPRLRSEAASEPTPAPPSSPEPRPAPGSPADAGPAAATGPEPAPAAAQVAGLQPADPAVTSPGPEVGPGPAPEVGRAPNGGADQEPAPQAAAASNQEPMPPAPSGAERRVHERVPTFGAALIKDNSGVPVPCAILNQSEGGAALRLSDEDQACPTRFSLEPFDGPARRCEVRWRRGDQIGVEFI